MREIQKQLAGRRPRQFHSEAGMHFPGLSGFEPLVLTDPAVTDPGLDILIVMATLRRLAFGCTTLADPAGIAEGGDFAMTLRSIY
jgi:hypothetical protein